MKDRIEMVKPQPKGVGGKSKKSLRARLADAMKKRMPTAGLVSRYMKRKKKAASISSAKKIADDRMKRMGKDSSRLR